MGMHTGSLVIHTLVYGTVRIFLLHPGHVIAFFHNNGTSVNVFFCKDTAIFAWVQHHRHFLKFSTACRELINWPFFSFSPTTLPLWFAACQETPPTTTMTTTTVLPGQIHALEEVHIKRRTPDDPSCTRGDTPTPKPPPFLDN